MKNLKKEIEGLKQMISNMNMELQTIKYNSCELFFMPCYNCHETKEGILKKVIFRDNTRSFYLCEDCLDRANKTTPCLLEQTKFFGSYMFSDYENKKTNNHYEKQYPRPNFHPYGKIDY